jgi:hypothetical protein
MKHRYLCLLISFVLASPLLRAQITADSVPSGMFAVNPNLTLSVGPCMTLDSASLDINCDGNPDFAFLLFKGATAIDGANWAALRVLNDSFEICKDTVAMFTYWNHPQYFNAGDPLVPNSNSVWANDDLYQFGDFGCMLCPGPSSQSNMYIAYRKTGQEGWMKITFNLVDGGSCSAPITLTVNKVLSPCLADGVEEHTEAGFALYPNPFGTTATLNAARVISEGTLTIYNATGQCVRRESGLNGTTFTVNRDELAEGIYLFVLRDENGSAGVQRVVISGTR